MGVFWLSNPSCDKLQSIVCNDPVVFEFILGQLFDIYPGKKTNLMKLIQQITHHQSTDITELEEARCQLNVIGLKDGTMNTLNIEPIDQL